MKITKKLQDFFDSGKPSALILSVVLSVLLITGLVQAATTISTNISTDGTITGNYASSTVLSVNNTAYFGGTASTTIDVAGNIVGPGTLSITGASTFTGAVTAIGNSNSGRASTTVFSVNNTAYFGGTATTTIGPAGNITVPSGGTVTVTTANTATSTLSVGCIQTYATSTATAIRIEFGVNNMASTTFRTGAASANGGGGQVVWVYGTCP